MFIYIGVKYNGVIHCCCFFPHRSPGHASVVQWEVEAAACYLMAICCCNSHPDNYATKNNQQVFGPYFSIAIANNIFWNTILLNVSIFYTFSVKELTCNIQGSVEIKN